MPEWPTNLNAVEISHCGFVHTRLSARAELVPLSFEVARAALEAGFGVQVGYAICDPQAYRQLGIDPDGNKDRVPNPQQLPFCPTDAPLYSSCDFFTEIHHLLNRDSHYEKIRSSLWRFRRFAEAILQNGSVVAVEFRFLDWDAIGVPMIRLDCSTDDFVEKVVGVIDDPGDVPDMQVFVRRPGVTAS